MGATATGGDECASNHVHGFLFTLLLYSRSILHYKLHERDTLPCSAHVTQAGYHWSIPPPSNISHVRLRWRCDNLRR